MDPNANLEELLSLAEAQVDGHGNYDAQMDEADAARMAELVLALDGWMKGGGFLPRAWQEAKHG